MKIAYCPQWGDVPVTPAVRALCDRAAATFEALGSRVELLDAPISRLVAMRRAIIALETDIGGMRRLAAGQLTRLSPPVQALLQHEWHWQEFTDALTERKRAVEAIMRMMLRYDLMLTPTAPLPPFAIDRDGPGTIDGQPVEDDCWMPAMFPFNLTGQPAISLPAGWTDERPAGRPADRRPASRRRRRAARCCRLRAGEPVGSPHSTGVRQATESMNLASATSLSLTPPASWVDSTISTLL